MFTITESERSPPKKRTAIEDLFGNVFVVRVEGPKPLLQRCEEEITMYRAEPCLLLDTNPLIWWKQNYERFPLLM